MKLAIIVLNWNHGKQTADCIDRMLSWNQLRPGIWVVDNGSERNDLESFQKQISNLHFIKNPTNKGFAGGNNVALKEILHSDYSAVLLLNYDAEILENDISKLLADFQEHSKLGIVGPILRDTSNPGLISIGGRDISRHIHTRIFKRREEFSQKGLLNVDYVPGSIALIKTEVFNKAGLLDENYFFSGEIADFCERLKQNGYTCAVDGRAEASHTPNPSGLRDTLYRYYNLRNRFLFIRKFRQKQKPIFFAYWICVGAAELLLNLFKFKFKAVRATYLALRDGLLGKFGNKNDYFIR
jgi:GT2 family glycosyltransferase